MAGDCWSALAVGLTYLHAWSPHKMADSTDDYERGLVLDPDEPTAITNPHRVLLICVRTKEIDDE